MATESEKKKTPIQNSDIYFPQELWAEYILPRLPVKTLLRFRCVCKYWCSLIDDPDFIYIHLKQYKKNCEKSRVLLMECLGYINYKGRRFTVGETLTLKQTTYVFKTSALYTLIGSCNGLVLLGLNHQLKLWNPSVRKCVYLPIPHPFRNTKLILGYAPRSDDYKVVSLKISCSSTRELSLGIYSLNCDLWRTKICKGKGFQKNDFTERICSIYFEGAAYWCDHDPYWSVATHLVCFDFDTEELIYIALPDVHTLTRCLFLLGESLAVFSVSSVSRSVWVMEKEGEMRSWSLWFSGDSSTEYNRSFEDQGKSVYFLPSRIFFVENSGTSFLYGKNSCKITSQRFQPLGKAVSRLIALEPYIESLVLSRGYAGRTMALSPGDTTLVCLN
ncbi:F-box/kelch-repeat protein At3g06240-like [Silene latifolia]|uniref:F-box/kelch-repeat protein At3g06240-like n=1 Tax=Silene latifolia TaxID=37657 RepID=UPI003D773FA9